jgi:hypothetical protein
MVESVERTEDGNRMARESAAQSCFGAERDGTDSIEHGWIDLGGGQERAKETGSSEERRGEILYHIGLQRAEAVEERRCINTTAASKSAKSPRPDAPGMMDRPIPAKSSFLRG